MLMVLQTKLELELETIKYREHTKLTEVLRIMERIYQLEL